MASTQQICHICKDSLPVTEISPIGCCLEWTNFFIKHMKNTASQQRYCRLCNKTIQTLSSFGCCPDCEETFNQYINGEIFLQQICCFCNEKKPIVEIILIGHCGDCIISF